jgi:hypothetical protein
MIASDPVGSERGRWGHSVMDGPGDHLLSWSSKDSWACHLYMKRLVYVRRGDTDGAMDSLTVCRRTGSGVARP